MFKRPLFFLMTAFTVLSANPKIGESVNQIKRNMLVEAASLNDPAVNRIYNSTTNNNYVYLNQHYAPHYFKNLNENFGQNQFNSCGYVATGMLLSFWDTYWDDNVVGENYEAHAGLYNNHVSLDVESPGSTREPASLYSNVSSYTYRSNIANFKNDYLHFLLLDMGVQLFGAGIDSYGMYFHQYPTLFQEYIYNYRGYSSSDVEVFSYSSGNSLSVKQKAIEYVKRGIPVKLGISKNDGSAHAVIAYDYNEATDDLYCHFGWGPNTTHVTIQSQRFTSYNNVVGFEFKNAHNHSNHYEYSNGDVTNTLCVCETKAPKQIDGSFDYIDVAPTFSWVAGPLGEEKWFRYTYRYEFRLLRSGNYSVFNSTWVQNANSITLSQSQLEAIANNATNPGGFIVEVALYENSATSTPLYRYGRTCYLPTRRSNDNNLYLAFSIVRKNWTKWKVRINNPTCIRISGEYNTKMCNFNDAKNWTSSLTNKETFTINPRSFTDVDISENWFATSITASWVFGGRRYVTYADHLDASGTLTSYTNIL